MKGYISYLAAMCLSMLISAIGHAQYPQGIDPSGPDKNIDFWESPEFIAAIALFILLLIFGLRWSRKALKKRDEKMEEEEKRKDGSESNQ